MGVPIIGQPHVDIQELNIRLLVCNDCGTIEELPDFSGNPDNDILLQLSAERHRNNLGIPHVGNLIKVPLKFWGNPKVKKEIVAQIRAGVGNVEGIDSIQKGFYDTKSTFQEDAMKCYQKHLRPKGRCPEWMDESKRLIPKTHAERKDAGLSAPGTTGPKVYLCNFCPVTAYMRKRQSEDAMRMRGRR